MTLLLLKDQPGFSPLDNSAAATVGFVRQELPGHPDPRLTGTGLQGPDAAPPPQIQARGIVGQEWPWHPPPQAWAGDQRHPNVAAPPQVQAATISREQPWHPGAQAWSDQAHLAAAPPPQIQQRTLAQEQPAPLPSPQLAAGIQGPNVAAPPQVASTSTRQEPPWHPDARFEIPGVQGPSVAAPPQVQRAAVAPEAPLALPAPQLATGIAANVASPPQVRQQTVGQEQPAPLPAPLLQPGVRTSTAPPPQIQSAVVRQEQQPAAFAGAGSLAMPAAVLGPGVQAVLPFYAQLRTVQERPAEPPPFTRAGVQGPNVATRVGAVSLAQEQPPALPPARIWPSVQGPTVLAPVSQIVVVTQEQPPALPPPRLWPGQPAWIVTTDFAAPAEWLAVGRVDPPVAIEPLGTQRIDPAVAAELGLMAAADPPGAIENLMTRQLGGVVPAQAEIEWAASFRADLLPAIESGTSAVRDTLLADEIGLTARGDAAAPLEITVHATTTADSALPLGWLFNPFVFGRRRLRLLGRSSRIGE
jgi:hypothetical protein